MGGSVAAAPSVVVVDAETVPLTDKGPRRDGSAAPAGVLVYAQMNTDQEPPICDHLCQENLFDTRRVRNGVRPWRSFVRHQTGQRRGQTLEIRLDSRRVRPL